MVAIEKSSRRGKTSKLKRCVYGILGCICTFFLLPLFAPLVISEPKYMPQSGEVVTISHLRPPRVGQKKEGTPDGYFNGFPVYARQHPSNNDDNDPIHSTVHCVGENFHDDSWTQRSCHFSMLCFDLDYQDFVIFQSRNDEVLHKFLHARPAMDASTAMFKTASETTGVMLGGLNLKWSIETKKKPSSTSFKWFPRILNATEGMRYYELPSNAVMIPYHSLSAKNPGHLVWDDFLPIFTLLTMFQLQNRDILPLRMLFKEKLWASCEASDENEHACQKMTKKFWPLMGGSNYKYNITTTNQVHFVLNKQSTRHSKYVCAPRGAAGLGPLTDHGTKKLHGWIRDDYKITHNHGRGAMLYEFRNFMLSNIGLPITTVNPNPPYKIVFSLSSSDIPARNLDFEKQMATLQHDFPEAKIEAYSMKDLSVKEQVKLASETSIFITMCGGGAVTGMFLPKGASVILYYLEHGGVEYGVLTHLPAQLDWDLFNNLSHLRVHWMPTQTMDQRVDLRALTLLVRHELEMIRDQTLV